jgi:hypothetical protein
MERVVLKVYMDNVVASAITKKDLEPAEEQEALEAILIPSDKFGLYVSPQCNREMDRIPNEEHRRERTAGIAGYPHVKDVYLILGFQSPLDWRIGGAVGPLIDDKPDRKLYEWLRSLGLDENDAMHMMYAIHNTCDIFLTNDRKNFSSRREKIQERYPSIKVTWPTEFRARFLLPIVTAGAALG